MHAEYVTTENIDGFAMGLIDPKTDLKDVKVSQIKSKVFESILKYFKAS